MVYISTWPERGTEPGAVLEPDDRSGQLKCVNPESFDAFDKMTKYLQQCKYIKVLGDPALGLYGLARVRATLQFTLLILPQKHLTLK